MTTSHPCFSYDVFLSFRGEDTRKSFTDHLYAALKQAGIRTFRDNDAMDRGKLLEPELKKAICESAISIIIFSTNYASSKWCLDEVLTITEQERLSSMHEVVPVFYNVEPSEVRNQTGCFEEAFARYNEIIEAETDHQKKIHWLQKLNAWRASLRKVGSLTGMVLANGHEANFISKIVSVVRKKLDYKLLYIEDKLVGINSNVAEIELWLQDPSPNATILMIHGMGGIGKTTISKCIYNSNFQVYDGSCFLADINEKSNHQYSGLLRLQSQLLSTVLRSEKEEVIWNLDEGTHKIRDAICNKKVLLVLDDVTTRQQLTSLLGPQQFYPGSKVIITTRHAWLLNAFKVHPKVLTVGELSPNDSNELFSLYAFDRDSPMEDYIVQSELLVRHCRGLPLALKVLGSFLNGKTMDVWQDAIRKLEAIPNPEIQKLLQLSYDTLEDTKDKDLFLHVACFFVGEDKEFIVKLLAECDLYPIVGIQNLMDRCLVYIENGRVMMHPLIKEMGQEVVRQEAPKDPGKRSRLWHHQDSFNVLKDNSGTRKVEGLMLDMRTINATNLTSIVKLDSGRKRSYEAFLCSMQENEAKIKVGAIEKMKNLILLQLDYATFSGNCRKLPKNLRLLRWHGFSLKSIPLGVPLEKLVVLDMRYSKLKEVWDGFKVIGSLKVLNLSYSVELTKTPDFCGLPSLESLILEGCISLTRVCESIAYLERLALLDVSDCKSLKEVPCFARSLVSLKMSGCPNLGVLGQIRCLDSSLPSLLVNVDISKCNLFNSSFPEDWSNLFSLKFLNISGNNISSLPNCIQSLPSLKILTSINCPQLQSILGVPKSVNELYAYENTSLERVQTSQNLLTRIDIHKCYKLCALEGCFKLASIQKVDRKIIRYLGLESILEEAKPPGLDDDKQKLCAEKVAYEFGIFSTYVLTKTFPSSFMHKERGSTISFRVPSHPNGSRINGLNVCFKSTPPFNDTPLIYKVEVNNKTKVVVWKYTPTAHIVTCKKMRGVDYVWLSYWKIGNLLEDGDEVAVCIDLCYGDIVDECCINLVYEEDGDEDLEGKRRHDEEYKDDDAHYSSSNNINDTTHAHYVSMLDQISWTDRLLVEISDYVHTGKTYCFKIGGATDVPNSDGISDLIVDWWGLRTDWRCRQITVL